jgi:hypothetical protein
MLIKFKNKDGNLTGTEEIAEIIAGHHPVPGILYRPFFKR